MFVPLLGLSAAGYSGVLPLNDQFAWLGSLPALIILGVALAAEIGAYYLPIVDNFLDAIVAPASFVAGTLAMAAQFGNVSPGVDVVHRNHCWRRNRKPHPRENWSVRTWQAPRPQADSQIRLSQRAS